MSGKERELTTFAWQGMQITVPEDWNLVSTSGDYGSGFISMADEDQVRLQLKWDNDKAQTDPSEAASRYLRELRKEAPKEGSDIVVNRRLNLASLQGKKIECYDWISSNRGTGMVSRCETCDRMIHLVVLGRRDESLRTLSRTIFASLKDHPDDEHVIWDFYDLHFETPRNLPLKRSELKTGCIRMQFQQKSEELEIVRSSLAKFILKNQGIEEWLLDFYSSEIKRHGYTIEDAHYKGHAGIAIQGKPWLILDPWRILGKGKMLNIACWHCTTSNRIFIIGHGSREDAPVLQKVIDSTVCCTGEQG